MNCTIRFAGKLRPFSMATFALFSKWSTALFPTSLITSSKYSLFSVKNLYCVLTCSNYALDQLPDESFPPYSLSPSCFPMNGLRVTTMRDMS